MNIDNGQKEFESADILKSVGKRTGAGIESVVVNYEGIDSATKKIVMVQAKFVFQDLRERCLVTNIQNYSYYKLQKSRRQKLF